MPSELPIRGISDSTGTSSVIDEKNPVEILKKKKIKSKGSEPVPNYEIPRETHRRITRKRKTLSLIVELPRNQLFATSRRQFHTAPHRRTKFLRIHMRKLVVKSVKVVPGDRAGLQRPWWSQQPTSEDVGCQNEEKRIVKETRTLSYRFWGRKREVVVFLDLDVSMKGLEIQRGLVPVFFLHDGIVWLR
ncbi:973_t:CDS:2 [Scutellospora calospora]|uniref:973_t:CDS:1 n=1 Tax=Scutellospora calospora TaxID=85575 RepID=A0ACA9K5B3_9GLOM|nr:973_t:CDS:2 [Scutellospora calospora]